jgi:hypothetical protein
VRRLLIIGLLVLLGAIIAYTLTENPHSFSEKECYNCHVDPDGDRRRLTAPVTKLCRGCHPVILEATTHPVDVVPRIAAIPIDLPLTDGKLTCITCHNVHADNELAFGIKSYFLRRVVTDVKDFCVACHEDNLERPGHKELFIVSHEANKYVITNPDEPLDPLSAECIGCHDGTIGPVANFSLGAGMWMHEGSGHLIGVNYNEARMRNGGLRPMSELDKRLRFFEGRVGCATCHDWFLDRNVRLVMEIERSRLCTECHSDK